MQHMKKDQMCVREREREKKEKRKYESTEIKLYFSILIYFCESRRDKIKGVYINPISINL